MKYVYSLVLVFSIPLIMAGCASSGGSAQENSGFLNDYSMLKATKDSTGDNFKRYVNADVDFKSYHSVIIDHVDFYPTPRATERVSAQVLIEIANYVDKQLNEKIGKIIKVVSEPGPGVARIRPAITAVAPDTRKLKPYEYVPIAFIVTSIRGRGESATIQIENMSLDSVSGQLLTTSVRQGQGVKLKDENAVLTLKDLQPLLDKWVEASASNVAEFIK